MIDLRTRLTRLSENLWWSWSNELDLIFRLIDNDLWREVNHNPVAFLKTVDDQLLATRGNEAVVLAQTTHAEMSLRSYLESERHWAAWNAPSFRAAPVAYFSPEFCIHQSLPIYSGGLGVLAGDHLKSCSDLGIPTYGISLLYRQGYFTQHIDADGNQQELYCDLDTSRVPIKPITDAKGEQVTIVVPFNDGEVQVGLWQAEIGRCHLLLLEYLACAPTGCFPQTLRLYGGDRLTRIQHEIVLGVGGYRALRALGIRPGVLHLNEGHSAFAIFEAIAQQMEETGLPFARVAHEVAESVVFTTHTPVEAGHDRFAPEMVLDALRPLQKRLGISDSELLAFGRTNPENEHEEFCMTTLALRLSQRANAVSALHGTVTREMWRPLWPGRDSADIPIGHITNGTHVDSWLAMEIAQLFTDCLGSNWKTHLCDPLYWQLINNLDDFQLWGVKSALKQRLLSFVQRRLTSRWERLGLAEPMPTLRMDALTIGFARRFASYKRALLLFRDLDRFKRLVTNAERPVQIVFAGKAHPADEPGKAIIRRLLEIRHDPELRNHLVFVEDHDKNVSRHLLEGCELWLNSPRRPLEACGTSGMKAVFNGTLNCSVLDGWWNEAYNTQNGFAFGEGQVHVDPEVQDQRDHESMMRVLENEVVPLYFQRNEAGIPVEWLKRVKNALITLAWRYNADRMVKDYALRMYLPASRTLTAENRF